MNKNSLKNLIKHNYVNELTICTYYYAKNKICNSYEYIFLFNNRQILENSIFNIDSISYNHYNENIKMKYDFFEDIESFFKIKKRIFVKEQKIRKINKSLHIFTNNHKICDDIHRLILSFLI